MAFNIENIEVTGESIRNAIIYFCKKTQDEKGRTIPTRPTFIPRAESKPFYRQLFLFGIRVSSCDTALPDDIIGGIRFMPNRLSTGGFWEIEVTNASTDPSPLYLQPPVNKVNGRCPSVTLTRPSGSKFTVSPPCTSKSKNCVAPCEEDIWSGVGENPFINKCCIYFDSQARAEGGAAWIAPGQYTYYYYGNFQGEPAFKPQQPVTAYRWAPSRPGETFDSSKVVKELPNYSTLIHRSWAKEKLFNDSAGCQIVPATKTLEKLASWAKEHRKAGYPNTFQYTLMTKDDFVNANSNTNRWWFPDWIKL